MKKTLVLTLLVSALALSLTGCKADKNDISDAVAITSASEKVTKKILSTEIKETTVRETEKITEQQSNKITENNIAEETPAIEITESITETQSDGEFTTDDLVFEYNGQIINLDEHINDVKAKIGEPLETNSAPSCYYDGNDKEFIYDGFTIYTYPDGENDYVVSIEFSTDAVSTVKGARVGMAVEEALAIYGEGYSINGSNYQYQIDDRYMYFYVENGFIVNIGIVLAN